MKSDLCISIIIIIIIIIIVVFVILNYNSNYNNNNNKCNNKCNNNNNNNNNKCNKSKFINTTCINGRSNMTFPNAHCCKQGVTTNMQTCNLSCTHRSGLTNNQMNTNQGKCCPFGNKNDGNSCQACHWQGNPNKSCRFFGVWTNKGNNNCTAFATDQRYNYTPMTETNYMHTCTWVG